MPSLSTYLANKLNDHSNGVAAYAMPTPYVALIRATAGQSPRSTAVTAGETTVPATMNGHMYRCTTPGPTGSAEPTWPTTSAGTVTDGTAVWTEMTPDFQANNSYVTGAEANYTGYARAAQASAMTASSSGSSSNTSAIVCPADTNGNNVMGAYYTYDAATVGNPLKFTVLNSVLSVSTNITPEFTVGALTTSVS